MFPLELQQGSWTSSRVAIETRSSSLVVAGNADFPLELLQGTQSSSPIAAGNQCSSGVPVWDAGFHCSHGGKLGVLLELCWYSGFLLICNGTSCRVPLGKLVSIRDVQGGSYLVAMMGGCSLVLARDYSIIVVRVNTVVAGISIFSNGGVQALFSLCCEVHLY